MLGEGSALFSQMTPVVADRRQAPVYVLGLSGLFYVTSGTVSSSSASVDLGTANLLLTPIDRGVG